MAGALLLDMTRSVYNVITVLQVLVTRRAGIVARRQNRVEGTCGGSCSVVDKFLTLEAGGGSLEALGGATLGRWFTLGRKALME